MQELKIAIEYERGLHFADFTIANMALQFLEHPYNINNKGQPAFHKEGTLHQNEFNSDPHKNVNDLVSELLRAETVSDKICKDLGTYNIPISETGAGKGIINPNVEHRTNGYKVIFGEQALEDLLKISGIHIHIDQYKPRIVDQFNALTALRPAIALMSSSPISHQRKNGVNCHRYKLISDPKEGVFAKIPENNQYIKSMEELAIRSKHRYNRWFNDFTENCHKFNLKPEYFINNFSIANTGYPDIRSRPDIGIGTFELRTNDTNTYRNVIAKAAMVLGYCRNMINNHIPVKNTSQDNQYEFSQKKIILPNEKTLQYYTSLSGKDGLLSKENNIYLQHVLAFAEKGLRPMEKPYLFPFKDMLYSGINVATEILMHIGHNGPYTIQESSSANQFMHSKQLNDLFFLEAHNV